GASGARARPVHAVALRYIAVQALRAATAVEHKDVPHVGDERHEAGAARDRLDRLGGAAGPLPGVGGARPGVRTRALALDERPPADRVPSGGGPLDPPRALDLARLASVRARMAAAVAGRASAATSRGHDDVGRD